MENITLTEIFDKLSKLKSLYERQKEYNKKYLSTEQGKLKMKEAKRRYYIRKKEALKEKNEISTN
jgi:hypothetical protein